MNISSSDWSADCILKWSDFSTSPIEQLSSSGAIRLSFALRILRWSDGADCTHSSLTDFKEVQTLHWHFCIGIDWTNLTHPWLTSKKHKRCVELLFYLLIRICYNLLCVRKHIYGTLSTDINFFAYLYIYINFGRIIHRFNNKS